MCLTAGGIEEDLRHLERFKVRLMLVVGALAVVLSIGTTGFALVEGWPIFDAFYMSLISVTTVGYREVHDLSTAGRAFNVGFLLLGVLVMFLGIGLVTDLVVTTELGEFFGRRRQRRMLEQLNHHYLICGYGRVGRAAGYELGRSGVAFVAIDSDPLRVETATRRGVFAIQADAGSDETLKEAGIERARGLIAALPNDAQNLFLVLSAKALNPGLKVASRVDEEESEVKFRRAGVDATFRPYNITGFRLAQAMLRPHVFEFLDMTTPTVDLGHNIGVEQVMVSENSALDGKSLAQLRLNRELGVIVLAIRRASGEMEFNPAAETVVRADDHLIVIGDLQQMNLVERIAESG